MNSTTNAVSVRCRRALSERQVGELSDVLVDCVEGGASVSFMLPFPRQKAEAFWAGVAASAAAGERLILIAEDVAGIPLAPSRYF